VNQGDENEYDVVEDKEEDRFDPRSVEVMCYASLQS
jgi:hypothetical protein